MYFGNIADSELKKYHETVKNNFSMSLSNVLSSDLFKIETIITDTIYKIYPLFYCDTITSTNKNDKILDNKCIICEKDTSTRLYFTSNILTDVELAYTRLLYCVYVFYDNASNRLLEGVTVSANIYNIYYDRWFSDEGVSDKDGLVYLPNIAKIGTGGSGTITAEYNGETIFIMGG